MSESALIYPESPDEYFTYGWYVSPYGGWKFGLPATPSSTSNTCGAMPFRNGTELCSPNCLRGEDWVYMAEWAEDRYNLPNGLALDPVLNLQGPYQVIASGPTLSQLSNMYTNLVELKTVWGNDFSLQDQQVSLNDVNDTLLSSLDRSYSLISQPPPASGDIPLQASRIQNFFTDMAKMKCTIGQAQHDQYGSPMAKELYQWSKQDGQPADEYEDFIESMRIRVNYYSERPMQFDAQFIALLYVHSLTRDRSGQTVADNEGHALYKLGNKTTITQDLSAQSDMQFSIPCHYGGYTLANDIVTNIDWWPEPIPLNPQPPNQGYSYFQLNLNYLYVAVWPKYLQL